jgi:hypothetical protein
MPQTTSLATARALARLACGTAIDRGHRRQLSRCVTVALLIAMARRVASGWAPRAALAAKTVGAAVGACTIPCS